MNRQQLFSLTGAIATMLLMVACRSQAQPETVTVIETVMVEVEQEKEVTVVKTIEVEVTVVKEVEVEKVVTSRGTGDSLTLLYWQAPSMLNPYLSGTTKGMHAASLVLEPLARYDETGQMVPWLAEEIPTLENGGVTEDLMSITWKLKEGLVWSDGSPLTAEDFVFTAEYCLDEEIGCASLANFDSVESTEALDASTVRINFSKPKPFPYGPFVGSVAPVLQKAQFEDCLGLKAQQCTDQNFNPIGTGPYQVKEFKANDVALYDINPNYRDPDKPFFKEVIIRGGGDAAGAARAVLETGEADYAWNLQVEPEVLNSMAIAGKGKVVSAFGTAVERLVLNLTNPDPALGEKRSAWSKEDPNPHPFLSDHTVRRAMSLAVDRNAIATQLYGAAGQPTCNVLPAPAIYVSANNDECLIQDIEEANRILDEAGIVDTDGDGIREKEGVPLIILYQTTTNSVRQNTQALIKQWWSQIGIETELRNIEPAVFFGGVPGSPDTVINFYADVEMYTNAFDGADPEIYMGNWHSREIPSSANEWVGINIPRWYNEDYDALVDQLAVIPRLEDRAEIVKQMNDMLVQDYALIPLIHRGDVSAHSNSLLGVRMNVWDSELWNIADWTRSSQ